MRDFLEPEVESLDIGGESNSADSDSNLHERDLIFSKEDVSDDGVRYEAEIGDDVVEVQVDEYPNIESFGYDPAKDRFTMKTSEGNIEEYVYASREQNFIGAIGTPFGNEIWELFYDTDQKTLGGRNRAVDGSGLRNLSSSDVGEKMKLMNETKKTISSYREGESENNIVLTDRYREDMDRLHGAERMGRDGKAIPTMDENLGLSGIEPVNVCEKPLNDNMHPLLQVDKYDKYRALFIEGYRVEGAQDDKLYGLRILDKNKGEQDQLSQKIRKNNTYPDSGTEFAENILDEEGII